MTHLSSRSGLFYERDNLRAEEKNFSSNVLIWLGLAQGLALYVLYKTHEAVLWPIEWGPLLNALLLSFLLLPLVVYWSQGILVRRTLTRLLLAVAIGIIGISAYQAATLFPAAELNKPQLIDFPVFIGLAMVSFMSVPFVSAWGASAKPGLALGRWEYATLFEHAWRNAVITLQAGVLTGLLWIVLRLGAELFRLIGVDWPRDVLEEAWFAIPVTTLSIALGIRAGLKRAAFVITLRNHWLTLTAWLLPLVGLIGSAFVLTSLGGVDKLFERGLSAFFLLWFAAFWIKFFNSAFQDGQSVPPLGPWLLKILPYTTLALLAITGLAAWALGLRVSQHGLTPDRVWGLLVVIVGLCYGVGYALSLANRAQWMSSIPHANVFAALVMAMGIVLLLSPVLDARKLSTSSQMSRLDAGKVNLAEFDVHALGSQGRFGYDALNRLAQQKTLKNEATPMALRAREAIETAQQNLVWRNTADKDSDVAVTDVRERLKIYPVGTSLPEDFVSFLQADIRTWDSWNRQDSCFNQNRKATHCSVLQVDLNHDQQPEMVLWKTRNDVQPGVYSKSRGVWKRVGYMVFSQAAPKAMDIQTQLMTESFTSSPYRWNELRIGETRYLVHEEPSLKQ